MGTGIVGNDYNLPDTPDRAFTCAKYVALDHNENAFDHLINSFGLSCFPCFFFSGISIILSNSLFIHIYLISMVRHKNSKRTGCKTWWAKQGKY